MHANLSFALDMENIHELPFLDVHVISPFSRASGTSTKVFRQATWTGQYPHFYSFVFVRYKAGFVWQVS